MPILYPYQLEYIYGTDTFDIWNKSRQIGVTSGGLAYKAVTRALEGVNQLLVSSSLRQSARIMDNVSIYLEALQRKNKGFKLLKDTATQKTLPNHKDIFCFPSKPETVRGFPGDVRIDEFALHRQDKKIYEALLPSITRKVKSNYQL